MTLDEFWENVPFEDRFAKDGMTLYLENGDEVYQDLLSKTHEDLQHLIWYLTEIIDRDLHYLSSLN